MKQLIVLIAVFVSLVITGFSQEQSEFSVKVVPKKVVKKFKKQHKDKQQEKYSLTDLDNIKISFLNSKMQECWAFYTPEGELLESVTIVPTSEIPTIVIPKIKALQKSLDDRYGKPSIIANKARIVQTPDGAKSYHIEIKDAVKTNSMEFSLDGKYRGNVLDDDEY